MFYIKYIDITNYSLYFPAYTLISWQNNITLLLKNS
jgi:hypothetical protein